MYVHKLGGQSNVCTVCGKYFATVQAGARDHIDSVISDYSRFYCAAFLFDDVNKLLSGLWIRIRMDPHYLSLLDPDIGEKNVWKKLKNAMKLVIIGILLQFLH